MNTNWASQNPEMEYHIQAKKISATWKDAGTPHKASDYFCQEVTFDDKVIQKELTGALNITLFIREKMTKKEIQQKFENVLPILKTMKRK